jgi:hypothetical protein
MGQRFASHSVIASDSEAIQNVWRYFRIEIAPSRNERNESAVERSRHHLTLTFGLSRWIASLSLAMTESVVYSLLLN